ncbi:hypothetical protein [Nocardioides campestrisoli]|uniref:hypothetical protein n=1 Tax=Nocardioides campestrisoli TaxID=2736757 RepID=UPI0015E68C13|nr:hypothetical protein [Nocardioides campestrisoli]
MDRTHAGVTTAGTAQPLRVREQAREALAVMAFSALASGALVLGLLVLGSLGR